MSKVLWNRKPTTGRLVTGRLVTFALILSWNRPLEKRLFGIHCHKEILKFDDSVKFRKNSKEGKFLRIELSRTIFIPAYKPRLDESISA